MAATYVFYVYVTPILEDGVGLSVWMVSIVLFFYGAATIVSNLGSGSIAQHYGLAKMPIMFGLQALVLLLLGPSLASGNTALAVINVVLTGVFIYHMNSPLQTFLLQTSAKDYPRRLPLRLLLCPPLPTWALLRGRSLAAWWLQALVLCGRAQ